MANIEGVAEVACFGIPSEKWGEAVHVNVILNEGLTITKEEVINYCKEAIGSINSPKSVKFVKEFPRNSNGKVLKRKMREVFWKEYDKKI